MHGPVPIHANPALSGKSGLVVPLAGKGGFAGAFAVVLTGVLQPTADSQPRSATSADKPAPQPVSPGGPIKGPARVKATGSATQAQDVKDPVAVTVSDAAGKTTGSGVPAQAKTADPESLPLVQPAAAQAAPPQAGPAAVSATPAVLKSQPSSDTSAVHTARTKKAAVAPASQPPPAPIAAGAPMILPAVTTNTVATPAPVTENAVQDVKAQSSGVVAAAPRDEQLSLTDRAGSPPPPAVPPSTVGTPEKLATGPASAPARVELSTVSGTPQELPSGAGLSLPPAAEPTQPAASTPTAASVAPLAPADQVVPALVEVLKTADGVQSVTVSLQPPELGQVQIRIDRSVDGATRVDITAERPETLQLLQRDQPRLEQVLNQAGLPADGRSVNFQVATPDQVSASASRPDSLATGSGDAGRGQSGGAWRQSQDHRQDPGTNSDASQRQTRTRWFRAGLDITA
jgi:flagellar hook-length control protein FliK